MSAYVYIGGVKWGVFISAVCWGFKVVAKMHKYQWKIIFPDKVKETLNCASASQLQWSSGAGGRKSTTTAKAAQVPNFYRTGHNPPSIKVYNILQSVLWPLLHTKATSQNHPLHACVCLIWVERQIVPLLLIYLAHIGCKKLSCGLIGCYFQLFVVGPLSLVWKLLVLPLLLLLSSYYVAQLRFSDPRRYQNNKIDQIKPPQK